MYDRLWKYNYKEFDNISRAILHVENFTPHRTMGFTYESVPLHFNDSQGNGLFNPASEWGWILWLRIWQCHFHTLRKWWFYTCWLSPCVKRLFHHCQQQYSSNPHPTILSCCRRASSQKTNVTRGERIHCGALFSEEYQSINMWFYKRYSIILNNKPPLDIWLNLVPQKCLRKDKKGAHLRPDSKLEI